MELKEKMKQIRKATGLNAETFAAEIGYSKSQINKIESGHEKVTDFIIDAIKKRYDVNDGFWKGTETLSINLENSLKQDGMFKKAFDALMKELEDKRKDVERWQADAADWKKVALHHMGKHKTLAQAGIFQLNGLTGNTSKSQRKGD